LNAGTLDRRIVIEQRTDTRDGSGDPVAAWTVLATVWAAHEPLTGKEQFEAHQVNAERPSKFVIRYRAGVDESMRVNWDGDLYDITSIVEIGRRDGLEFSCTAAVP